MNQHGRRGSGKRATALTAAMVARQRSRVPIGEWTLADYDDHTMVEGEFEKVSQLMDTNIVTVGPDDPIELVSELMDWTRVKYLPVENDRGELVGLVSDRGVLRHLTEAAQSPGEDGAFKVPVSDIMRTQLVTVTPHTPTREAIELMRRHRVGALPVVQGPHVVAMLTQDELVTLASRAIDVATSSPPAPSAEEPSE
jgi:CBS domain-containing protein